MFLCRIVLEQTEGHIYMYLAFKQNTVNTAEEVCTWRNQCDLI